MTHPAVRTSVCSRRCSPRSGLSRSGSGSGWEDAKALVTSADLYRRKIADPRHAARPRIVLIVGDPLDRLGHGIGPQGRGRVGSATSDTSMQVGGGLGVAVLGTALNIRYQHLMSALIGHHAVPPPPGPRWPTPPGYRSCRAWTSDCSSAPSWWQPRPPSYCWGFPSTRLRQEHPRKHPAGGPRAGNLAVPPRRRAAVLADSAGSTDEQHVPAGRPVRGARSRAGTVTPRSVRIMNRLIPNGPWFLPSRNRSLRQSARPGPPGPSLA